MTSRSTPWIVGVPDSPGLAPSIGAVGSARRPGLASSRVVDKATPASRSMNAGRARRFHDLATVRVAGAEAHAVVGLVEAEPHDLALTFRLVGRHPLGSQAFIPLTAVPFLVVTCPDEGDRPGQPQAVLTKPWQGVCYAPGTWHGVLTPFGRAQDFVVVDRGGVEVNLEEYPFDQAWVVSLPPSVG